ncbi:MAG: tRNA (adenosine(37)-N6)-dimethylallyltransferase MiaA [Ruminococcaceae bacterium]|nr:tRNA (adenosine(37)-N6)-dimethylallyltransferase MiaA [Oscillospiraceae bacterium]
MIKALFIVGPTASGKTDLSIFLAKALNGEIICADSMQIYKGIHVASAAPSESEKDGVTHHLFEFLNLDDEYSVADYVKAARTTIKEVSKKGKLPIIVGGTGLYVSSLLDNIEYIEQDCDPILREKLENKFNKIGAEAMLLELSEFDPDSAKRLHPNNRRRIIRAFEVYLQTGKTITEQNALSRQNESDIDPIVIGITYKNRELLYDRINRRVDIMLSNGLMDEACQTIGNNKKGAFQAIGHKELYPAILGEDSLENCAEKLKQQTRRYAKRQLTWFNRDERINWFYPDEDIDYLVNAFNLANNFLKEE